MPSVTPIDRAALASFIKDPRTVLAFERLFQNAGQASSTFSTGDLKPYAAATAPDGWLLCDGSAVSRTAYADLFTAIGTTWGPGDGVTTFNIPDLRGRALIGYDGSHAIGTTGGATSVVLATNQMPAHTHVVTDAGHTHVFSGSAHNHGVTDPGHGHGVTDPGHVHTGMVAANTNTAGAAAGSATAGNTGSAVTGLTVNSGVSNVTVNNATAAGTNANAATGITLANAGGTTAVPTQSPYAAVSYLIKT